MVVAKGKCELVLQLHGLHQRPEVVITVKPTVENPKDKVDLGGCENGNERR
jgi:hypothetical protein